MIFGKRLELNMKNASERQKENLRDFYCLLQKKKLKTQERTRFDFLLEWEKTTLYNFSDLSERDKKIVLCSGMTEDQILKIEKTRLDNLSTADNPQENNGELQ